MPQFNSLQITEILPNPEGKDGTAEFIELTNLSTEQINLTGCALDDSENGSKPYKMQTTIAPGQSLVFYKSETKISLNNTNDEARLFSPSGKLIDQLAYTKTTEGKSLSKIKILSSPAGQGLPPSEKLATLWTDPTPNEPPETFYKFDGHAPALAGAESPSLFLFHPSSSQKTISITSKDQLPPILASIINQNPETSLSLLTKKISNTEFELVDYKIMATKQTQDTQQIQPNQSYESKSQIKSYFLIPLLISLLILSLLAIHLLKKMRKANTIVP